MAEFVPSDAILRLIEQSLIAWRVLARAARGTDGAIVVTGLGRTVRIERAAHQLPFRYMVTVDTRQRPALSITALLRQVRGALDPAYEKTRVRIAALPLSPSPRSSRRPNRR